MSFAPLSRRSFLSLSGFAALSACAPAMPGTDQPIFSAGFLPGYGPVFDSGYTLPGIPGQYTQSPNRRITGQYLGEQAIGTIDVDPYSKFLYFVREGATSVRYPVGVGRAGLAFAGNGTIQLKRKWPGWTPTRNMIRREPEVYGPFSGGIPGGLRSPLGARALYLYKGGRDTYFRIHGTNDMESIGNSGSAGCIRMFNQDIIHLFELVPIGTPVHVRTEAEALRVDPENFNRGIDLPSRTVDPELIYGPTANTQAPVFDDPRDGMPATGGDNVPL
ncbi:L,D-transpeptidase [Pseudotabrizicola sediminis]|uniref:L,D-transpeptidase n=1 Tax=Pseudotabrizicola sediminis TaxID=2486418 RepID=A0ABY2KNW4_9RHOB|nr:L,D-transpeptidase [Pseudotabrizicola sediminis]TGD43736.1 L,D-transpeptidase [Pseudotabrizicola sediminis]